MPEGSKKPTYSTRAERKEGKKRKKKEKKEKVKLKRIEILIDRNVIVSKAIIFSFYTINMNSEQCGVKLGDK